MDQPNMKEEILKLLGLQVLDKQIYDMRRELEDFPEKLKAFDALIKEKESIYKTSEEALKKAQLKRKDKEIEMAGKEDAIKKHQAQLFQVKTNQEYTALTKEINSLKADVSVIEEILIGVFDEIDKIEKEITANKKIFEDEKSKIEKEKTVIDSRRKELESILKDTEEKRAQTAGTVDKDILSKYDRILNGRDGLAIVEIKGDACGGCNMNLPPQVVNEVRMMPDLVYCGNCMRILYYKEE